MYPLYDHIIYRYIHIHISCHQPLTILLVFVLMTLLLYQIAANERMQQIELYHYLVLDTIINITKTKKTKPTYLAPPLIYYHITITNNSCFSVHRYNITNKTYYRVSLLFSSNTTSFFCFCTTFSIIIHSFCILFFLVFHFFLLIFHITLIGFFFGCNGCCFRNGYVVVY